MVAAHVDDLIVTGVPGQGFDNLKHSLRERFRRKLEDRTVVFEQLSYVNTGIELTAVDTNRNLDQRLTAGEVTLLRGVWLLSIRQWHRLYHNMQQR